MPFWPFGKSKKKGKGRGAGGPTLNVESLSHLLKSGQLDEAYRKVKTIEGKGNPEDYFILFNVAIMAGDLAASKQALDSLAEMDPENTESVTTCRQLFAAEEWRQRWRQAADQVPATMSTPPNFLKAQCKAWYEFRAGKQAEALQTIEKAIEARPSVIGELRTHDGSRVRFEDLADADTFNETALEVLAPERFFLVPFSEIVRVEMEKPRNIFEGLLMPVTLETRTGQNGLVWVPTLYAGSHTDDDQNIRIGNGSKWRWVAEGVAVGSGQRCLRLLPKEKDQEEMEVPWHLIRSIRVEDVLY